MEYFNATNKEKSVYIFDSYQKTNINERQPISAILILYFNTRLFLIFNWRLPFPQWNR